MVTVIPTRHRPNAGLILSQRRRRWHNSKPTLDHLSVWPLRKDRKLSSQTEHATLVFPLEHCTIKCIFIIAPSICWTEDDEGYNWIYQYTPWFPTLTTRKYFLYKPWKLKDFFLIWNNHKFRLIFPRHLKTWMPMSTTIRNILILQCGDSLYASEYDVHRRHILTYKDGPRTERVTSTPDSRIWKHPSKHKTFWRTNAGLMLVERRIKRANINQHSFNVLCLLGRRPMFIRCGVWEKGGGGSRGWFKKLCELYTCIHVLPRVVFQLGSLPYTILESIARRRRGEITT